MDRLQYGLETLREAARSSELFLNEYCSRELAPPGTNVIGPATAAVARAAELTGQGLVGVIAFGPWVRGEAMPRSDVGLLVVLDPDVSLTRQLYRAWGRRRLAWDTREVEPQFVHLIDPGVRFSGTWAEVAMEGIVLVERGFEVSLRLVELRGQIAEGRIVRRVVHGQPYWVEAA